MHQSLNRLVGRYWGVFCASAIAFAAHAEDIVVPFGEERTLGTGDYGSIVVNGSLTVAENAVVTCTQLKVGVKDGANGADNLAVYTQDEGSAVTVNAKADGDLCLGNGALAKVTLNKGSKLTGTGKEAFIGYQNVPGPTTPIQIFLNDAELIAGAMMSVVANNGKVGTADVVQIHLAGSSARLAPRRFTVGTANGAVRILFEGGVLAGDDFCEQGKYGFLRSGTNTGGAVLRLESVDGAPIRVLCNGVNCQSAVFWPGKRANWWAGTGNSTFETLGTGAFVLEGVGGIPLISDPAAYDLVNFNHTGGFRISSGTTFVLDQGGVTTFGKMTSGGRISLPVGGVLDLKGSDLTIGSIDSAGTITDSTGATPTITLGADGSDSAFSVPPAAGIRLVKQGAGKLILPEGPLGEVTVKEGPVDFCDRNAVGFPYWRFWVTAPPQNKTVRFCEFAASNGTVDVRTDLTAVSYTVAGGSHYGSPANLFDGNVDTVWDDRVFTHADGTVDMSNRVFFVMHFGGAPQFDFRQFVDPAFADRKYTRFEPQTCAKAVPAVNGRIDRYAFFTCEQGWYQRTSPTHFRLQASLTGNDWRDMDVEDYETSLAWTSYAWSDLFKVPSCGKSPVSVGTLELADDSEWTIDMAQTDLSVGTLKAGKNVTVRLANVGKRSGVKTLPAVIGSCVNPENIATWTVLFDGVADPRRSLFYSDGTIGVNGPGFLLIIGGGTSVSPRTTAIHFAGDSTLDFHDGDESCYGSWGWNLRAWKKDGTELDVRAKSGYSTPSFRSAGYWASLLDAVKSGDWVVIEFGHNDQGTDRPGFNATIAEYTANLKTMIGEVRARGGNPLVCTPIVRRTQDTDGNLVEDPDENGKKLSDYAAAARTAAADENCPLVDMNALTTAEVLAVGVDAAAKYYVSGDRSHPNPEGAVRFAELFLADATSRSLAIAGLFRYN